MICTPSNCTPRTMEQMRKPTAYAFPTNIVDCGDHYSIEMQCPGRMKSDIAIAIENDILTVSAPAVSMKREGRTTYEGFTLPALKKSFNLGKNVDTSHIDAKLENGILILTLQKAATVKPRTIEVL